MCKSSGSGLQGVGVEIWAFGRFGASDAILLPVRWVGEDLGLRLFSICKGLGFWSFGLRDTVES